MNEDGPSLRDLPHSMENLLDNLCAQSSRAHICSRCGLEMTHLDSAFFLSEDERGWNISLPMCAAGVTAVVSKDEAVAKLIPKAESLL